MTLAAGWLKLEGPLPDDVSRREAEAALVRGLESSGRFRSVSVGARAPKGAATILVRVEADHDTERRIGYGFAYRVLAPDGATLLDLPVDGSCHGFAGRAFLDRLAQDAQLRLRDEDSPDVSFVASTRHFIEQRWKRPDDRRLGLDALAAFEAARRQGDATAGDVAAVVAAARSSRDGVMDVGGRTLAKLAVTSAAAQEAFRELARSRAWRHRFVAVAYLGRAHPRPLLVELLRGGLADRAARVVKKAAERCAEARLEELVPDLETASKAASPEDREWLQLMVELTRQGYSVRRDDDEWELVVQLEDGTSSQLIEQADLAPARLRRLVEEARSGR